MVTCAIPMMSAKGITWLCPKTRRSSSWPTRCWRRSTGSSATSLYPTPSGWVFKRKGGARAPPFLCLGRSGILALVAAAGLTRFAAEFFLVAELLLAVKSGFSRRRAARRFVAARGQVAGPLLLRTGRGFAALVQRGRYAHPALLALADQGREFRRYVGRNLEQGFHLEHPDRADILLGDFALAADFRQQPFGIGIALAPDIQAKPDAVRHGA